MAIQNPNINTNIETPTPAFNMNDAALKALLLGMKGGQDSADAKQGLQNAISLDKSKTVNSQNAIQDLLQGKPAADGTRDAPFIPEGASIKAGDVSVGVDPSAKLAQMQLQNQNKQTQNEEGATKQAVQAYTHATAPLQKSISSAVEGLEFTNDPKQTGSLGLARTKLLSAMGMNRYNSDEAKAVLPSSLQGPVADLFNSAGDDSSPINDSQKRSVNSAFLGILNQAKEQHEAAKQSAVGSYNLSNYANPTKAQALSQQLGQGTASSIENAIKKYGNLATTQTAVEDRPAPSGLVDRATAGVRDKLKDYFSPKAAAPVQNSSGPHGPSVIQNGVTYKWNPATNQYE